MVLIGVILVLLAAAAGVVLIAGTAQLTDSVQIDVLGGTLSIPPLTLLITGMVVISVFWLGWVLLRGGLRRGKRRRVEAKEAAAAAEAKRVEEQTRMQEEFATREQALTEERRRREEAEALVADQRTTTNAGPATTTDAGPATTTDAGPATTADRPVSADTTRSTDQDTTRSTDQDTIRSTDPATTPARESSDAGPRHGDRQVGSSRVGHGAASLLVRAAPSRPHPPGLARTPPREGQPTPVTLDV
jgi:hypothetical protein